MTEKDEREKESEEIEKAKGPILPAARVSMISFISGAAYGITSVVVGQPLDTIKTRMQAIPSSSKPTTVSTFLSLYKNEGLKGLYRGGIPPAIGGVLFRSAQFGCFETALTFCHKYFGREQHHYFGFLNPQILVAGFAGGFGRGVIEGPFEYVKVRQQVGQPWTVRGMLNGTTLTIARNCFLFSSFVLYIDVAENVFHLELPPFWKGAICGNLAWLTIWPLDVTKSQVQSGNYKGVSTTRLLISLFKTGSMFRGLGPGLLRSAIANGSSMYVFQKTKTFLEKNWR